MVSSRILVHRAAKVHNNVRDRDLEVIIEFLRDPATTITIRPSIINCGTFRLWPSLFVLLFTAGLLLATVICYSFPRSIKQFGTGTVMRKQKLSLVSLLC